MAEETTIIPAGQFSLLRAAAARFFSEAEDGVRLHAGDSAWSLLQPDLRAEALEIAAGLADLATSLGPAIRRSALLSEVDAREAGRAIKAMRAALKFRRFQHWDSSVLHDEDVVLGVRPGGESDDDPLTPSEAAEVFEYWAASLNGRLELIDPHAAGASELALIPTKSVATGYRPNTAFIMMWMAKDNPELTDLSNTIKRCFAAFDVAAVRSDDIEHAEVITERIIDEIRSSEFLIADLTGERPSVYYEVGVAHTLGKRPMLYRRSGTAVHFDVAHFNCPEYSNFTELEQKLLNRLEALTGRSPKKAAS
ncbi:MAG: hypothetical protein AABN34_24500 [Acidobacteriota bacterium]